MPPPKSTTAFVEVVRQSGVIDLGRLEDYLRQPAPVAAPPDRPEQLAGAMVRDGLLTHFQAERFLQGKWRHFVIGKYKVLECLGSGGMCSVYLCEHLLMRRRVAIKVLPPAQSQDPAVLGRFHREARAAAALDHPNIVHAFDVDKDETLYFLVMEYVEGVNLHELVKRSGPLAIARAANYVCQASAGLAHAHQHGLIHRDIKPSNLLLDRQGVVKILDLGLARFFNDESDPLTREHNEVVLGTADYLAPEQALDSHGVDHRADLYSLGLTLYYLLTGSTPFGSGTTAQKLIWHQVRQPKPARELRPEVPDALDAVLMRLIAKEPTARYQQAADVMAALAPWGNQPISLPADHEMPRLSPAAQASGPPSPPLPGPRAVFAGPPTEAQAGEYAARLGADLAGPDTDIRDALGDSPYRKRQAAAQRRWLWWNAGAGLFLLTIAGLFFTFVLRQGSPPATTARPPDPPQPPSPAQTAIRELNARVKNPASNAEQLRRDLLAFPSQFPGTPESLTAGRLLMEVRSPFDQLKSRAIPEPLRAQWQPLELVAVLGPVAKESSVPPWTGGEVEWVHEWPDGRILAQGTQDKVLKLWDALTGKEVVSFLDCQMTWWPWPSPDGKTMGCLDYRDGKEPPRLWDITTGKARPPFEGQTASTVWGGFSPDGKIVVTASDENLIRVYDAHTARPLRTLSGHTGTIFAMKLSPDGATLASGDKDHVVRLWDVATGQVQLTLKGHRGPVRYVCFSPDGKTLGTASDDGTAKLWELPEGKERAVLPLPVRHRLCFAPDGKSVAIGVNDGSVQVFDVKTGTIQHHLAGHDGEPYHLAISPDGRILLATTHKGHNVLWHLPTEKKLREWRQPQESYAYFTSDGRHLIAHGGGTAYILRLLASGGGG